MSAHKREKRLSSHFKEALSRKSLDESGNSFSARAVWWREACPHRHQLRRSERSMSPRLRIWMTQNRMRADGVRPATVRAIRTRASRSARAARVCRSAARTRAPADTTRAPRPPERT